MALAPVARLGAYEILTLIGSGGMGEVYRARDRKLDRDVTIKVLPSDVAVDPDRLARLEREAKTLAALNHPNIAHISGVEDSTGIPVCTSCGQRFECCAGGCWCDAVLVTDFARIALGARFVDCLCKSCLRRHS